MKKILLSIVTILYMGMSSGIAMDVHYCMGKMAGVDFYTTSNDKCSRCGMKEKKGGCCNDEHKFYKLSDSHKNVVNNLHFYTGDICIIDNSSMLNRQPGIYEPVIVNSDHAPPGDTGPSLCIMNCVFRI